MRYGAQASRRRVRRMRDQTAPATQDTQSRDNDRAGRWSVILFLVAGGIFVACLGFLTERGWGTEEQTLYNIPHTYLHQGKIAFPAYGYWYPSSYERLFVHPPTHYFLIGLLLKAGLSLYYAEAVPLAVFTILCLVLVATAGYPPEVSLGLMGGVMSGIGWINTVGAGDFAFHLRPDAHMAMAMLCGLFALEAARMRHWNGPRLLLGAFLCTYASTVHYSGWLGWLSVLVYLSLSVRQLGMRRARPTIVWAGLGGLLAGIPYLIFHVLPNARDLRYIASTQPKIDLSTIVQANFPTYAGMVQHQSQWPLPELLYALPLLLALKYSVPPFVIATITLLAHGRTRALALGSLPVPVFLFFLLHRKLYFYYYLENILLLAGFWLLVSVAWKRLLSTALPERVQWLAPVSFGALLASGLAQTTPGLRGAEMKFRVHELTLNRAVAKEVVGGNALIASVHSLWYFSGASTWFDLTRDLLWNPPTFDLRTYFSRFDAVAVGHLSAFGTQTGLTEASLYEKGILRFQGFQTSAVSPSYKWVWLTGKRGRPVTGFCWQGGRLRKFQETAGGDHVMLTAVVPASEIDSLKKELAPLEYWALDLPQKDRYAAVFLLEAARFQKVSMTFFGQYNTLETIPGNLTAVDSSEILARWQGKEDLVRYPENYTEVLAGLARDDLGASADRLQFREVVVGTSHIVAGVPEIFDMQTKSKGIEWLAVAELPELVASSHYLATLDLRLRAGRIGVLVLCDGAPQPTASLLRDGPRDWSAERLLFQTGVTPQRYRIVISSNNARSDIRFSLRNASVRRVSLGE